MWKNLEEWGKTISKTEIVFIFRTIVISLIVSCVVELTIRMVKQCLQAQAVGRVNLHLSLHHNFGIVSPGDNVRGWINVKKTRGKNLNPTKAFLHTDPLQVKTGQRILPEKQGWIFCIDWSEGKYSNMYYAINQLYRNSTHSESERIPSNNM